MELDREYGEAYMFHDYKEAKAGSSVTSTLRVQSNLYDIDDGGVEIDEDIRIVGRGLDTREHRIAKSKS